MNSRLLILIFLAGAMGFSSCKDKDLPQAAGLTTSLTLVNATADTINYYINGTRQNGLSPIFSGGVLLYGQTLTGEQNYSFKKSGSPVTLFSRQFTLDTSTYYTIFVGGEASNKSFLTKDNLDSATKVLALDSPVTSAMVRFVQASGDAPLLDITEDKGDTVGLHSVSFGYVSKFFKIAAGSKRSIQVYQSGTTNAPFDTTLSFTSGIIYTLFTKGKINGTGNSALSVVLMTNR